MAIKKDSRLSALQKTQYPAHLITTDFPPSYGGLETYAWNLTLGLKEIGALSAGIGGTPATDATAVLSAAKPYLKLAWHRRRDRLGAAWWSARDIFGAAFSHRLRLHMQWNTALPSWWLKRSGKHYPYIVMIHGAEISERREPVRRLMRGVLENADAVVAGSRFTANFLLSQNIFPRELRINPYGMDPPPPASERADPGRRPRLEMLCVHRLVPRKGTQDLLRALGKINRSSAFRGKWRLTLAGDGPENTTLAGLIESENLGEAVVLAGSITEARKKSLLRASDLFILPSLPPEGNDYIEGLGLGLLEAQAYGLPVLAASTGGIPEALIEGRTGWLFPGGSLPGLQSVLEEILRGDPGELSRRGAAGPDFIAGTFSWERNLAFWSRLILECV